MSGAPGPASNRISGVRTMVPAMRARASRTSFRAMGRTGSTTQHQRGGGDVFDRHPNRLEQRDLRVVAPARSSSRNDGADLRHFTLRGDDVARFAQCRLTRVDEDARGRDERVVELAPVGPSGADRVDVRSEEHTSELQSLAYLVCR